MSESFEDRLARSLIEIVPEPPTGDLAGAARTYARRARRRRQGVVAGAAAVAVLAAIGVPWAVTRGGEPGGDRGDEPVKEPEAALLECPEKVDRGALPGEPNEPLKKGAVRAVLCPVGGFGTFQPPLDGLETGLDDLVEAANARPIADPPSSCTLEGGLAWTALLQYPDGTVASVSGENYGCERLDLGRPPELPGKGTRSGASQIYQRYLGLLAAQRATREPPGAEVPLSCPSYNPDGPGFSPVQPDPKALGLTSAVLCWKSETLTETPYQSAELDARLVDLINTDLAERVSEEHDAGECSAEQRVDIVGQNAWGDRIRIPGAGCGWFGVGDWFWQPSADVQERFDDLMESQPQPEITLPTAADQPDAVVSAWADLINSGEHAKADSLWAVEAALPSAGVTQIGFSDSNMRRIDPEPGSPTAAYSQIWLMKGALYWEKPGNDIRNVDITIVRDSDAEPWRILEIADRGRASVGR
jgi:hypothetical protein